MGEFSQCGPRAEETRSMRVGGFLVISLLAGFPPLRAQQPLALQEAVRIALESHPVMEASQAAEREAQVGIRLARAGHLPRVRYSESYMRSNNPVFVFGSLLNQRQFGPGNFDIERLNNPDGLQNFQSQLRVEQTLFDAQGTKHAVQAARLQQDLSTEERQAAESAVILGVVETYFAAVLAVENLSVAEESVRTARADLRRAQSMIEAGMATKADVLSVQVHLAAIEEERIRAANDIGVAQAALNDALGLDLDGRHDLTTALTAFRSPGLSPEQYRGLAESQKPDLRRASLQTALSEVQLRQAKSALWPRLIAQGVLEADRQTFASRAGGNWLAGASLQWDVWKGSENRARVALARHSRERAAALEKQARSGVLLELRRAYAALQSASERVTVSDAAVGQAEESHRIIQNRYEHGLENVTELLRSETALAATRFRRLTALYDQRRAGAVLEHAAGNLTVSSEVLQ